MSFNNPDSIITHLLINFNRKMKIMPQIRSNYHTSSDKVFLKSPFLPNKDIFRKKRTKIANNYFSKTQKYTIIKKQTISLNIPG